MKSKTSFFFLFFLLSYFAHTQSEQVTIEGGIEIDSLLIRNLPAFRAESTQTFDIINLALNTIVLYNSGWVDEPTTNHNSVFDNANNFDSSTGIFKAPRSGLYWLESDLVFIGGRYFDDRIEAYLSVNENITDNCIRGEFTLQSGGNPGPFHSQRKLGGIIKLNEGDKVSLRVGYFDGPGFEVFTMDSNTTFMGYLITDLD